MFLFICGEFLSSKCPATMEERENTEKGKESEEEGEKERPTKEEEEEEAFLRFFVVGDPGQPGPDRKAVAIGMAFLQAEWERNGEPLALFVISTGDNNYTAACDEGAYERMEEEMLRVVPLPWLMALGNHDVTPQKALWHFQRHASPDGRWICPSPAFRAGDYLKFASAQSQRCFDLIDLYVINTNKYNAVIRRDSAGPSTFYQSRDPNWWREQKRTLERCLSVPSRRWKIVVGHHPCEYISWNFCEHSLPVVRFLTTTFMRGSPKSQLSRRGLAHVIRRGADLYLSGHQHLFAAMRLSAIGRPVDETRCFFVIVGASSVLDQNHQVLDDSSSSDPATPRISRKFSDMFSDDSVPPRIITKPEDTSLPSESDRVEPPLFSGGVEIEMTDLRERETLIRSDDASSSTVRRTYEYVTSSFSTPVEPNERFEHCWRSPSCFGFAVVDVTRTRMRVRCFVISRSGKPVEVYSSTESRE